jgi:uncharacterized protein involved in outer membrane biogenesis
MKKLIKMVVVLAVLVIVAIVAVVFYIDSIAKSAIERGSTFALGVPTTLDKADVKILAGEFEMGGLDVSNPHGYGTDHFLTLKDGDVAVSLGSLRQPTVELPQLTLSGIDMNLEKKDGKANYQVILDNLKKLESGETKPADPDAQKYVIRKLNVRDIMVHLDMGITKLDVPVDEIVLEDVGSGGKAVKITDLAGVLIKAVLTAVANKAGDIIPGDIAGELKGALAQLESLEQIADVKKIGEIGKKLTDDAGKVIGEIGDKLPGVGDKAGDGLGDVGDKAKEGLGGLLGGEKKK